MKSTTVAATAATFLALATTTASAETWKARDLYNYLKRACEVQYQVEEAITDSSGNVTRDDRGQVRTRMVARTRVDHSCVPNRFSQLRISQPAEFIEVDERMIGTDYIFFNAGPVDFKCRASARMYGPTRASRRERSVTSKGRWWAGSHGCGMTTSS